ncbi:hypothetical protein F5Y16DRAFT_384908 [Xylariaceae sp. FL0255]|nr:hypothetical protein F5Y16DRAFT_384908 [Xylariaceae sp. FL0255]
MARVSAQIFTSRETSTDDPEALPRKSLRNGFLEPSERITAHQLFFLVGMHGLGAAIISGSINLAIAVADYGTTKQSIHLFEFPNPLVGDAAVTVILQCIITWLIEVIIVNQDLKNGNIRPVGWIQEPQNRYLRWFWFLGRNDAGIDRGFLLSWVCFLFAQALRAFMTSIIAFAVFIGPVIGLLKLGGTPSGADWIYPGGLKPSLETWKPEIFKAILGASLGFVITPPYALFWLSRCGWALKANEVNYGQKVEALKA